MTVYFYIVGMTLGNMSAVMGASDKLVELMDHESAINAYGGDIIDEGKEVVKGILDFRDVKFHYPSRPGVQVLKGVSFSVDSEKNRVVALCGTSGCGKSSIISLIERFYDPNEGGIFFNGRDIKELEPKWYH